MVFSVILKARDELFNMKLRLSLIHLLLGIKDLNSHIHGTAKRTGTNYLNFDLNMK